MDLRRAAPGSAAAGRLRSTLWGLAGGCGPETATPDPETTTDEKLQVPRHRSARRFALDDAGPGARAHDRRNQDRVARARAARRLSPRRARPEGRRRRPRTRHDARPRRLGPALEPGCA